MTSRSRGLVCAVLGWLLPAAVAAQEPRLAGEPLVARFASVVDLAVRAGAVTVEIRRDVALDTTPGLLGRRWRVSIGGLGAALPLDGGRESTRSDAHGNRLTVTYDGGTRPVRIDAPAGLQFALTLDAAGHLTSVRASTGDEVSYRYSGDDLSEVRTNNGPPTRYAYGTTGSGPTRIEHPIDGPVELTYDAAGRVVSYRWADGTIDRIEYDDANRVERRIDPAGGATVTRQVAGQTIRVETTTPASGLSTTIADPAARTVRIEGPNGAVTRITSDEQDRVVSVIDPAGGTTRYEYAPTGSQLRAEILPNGVRHEYEYDAAGGLTAERLGGRLLRAFTYNADGTLASRQEAGSPPLRFTYAGGRLATAADELGQTTTFTYDARGNVVSARAPGNRTTTYAYDSQNRVTSITSPWSGTTRYTYDDRGRVTEVAEQTGAVTRYEYDLRSRMTAVVDALGRRRQLTYAPGGALASAMTSSGDEARYSYDAAGRIAVVTRPSGGKTVFSYDGAGNITGLVNPAGLQHTYTYDAAGRRTRESDAAGTVTTLTYDPAGRVTRRQSGRESIGVRYDDLGRLIEADDGRFPVRYTYDAAGRVTATEYPKIKQTVRSEFRADGLRTRLIATDGTAIGYEYTDLGETSAIVLPTGAKLQFAYDASGRLQTVTYPNGVVGTWKYSADGRVSSVSYKDAAGQTFTSADYAFNQAGDPIERRDQTGRTARFTYDTSGQLIEERTAGAATQYRYAAGGNRTAAVHDGTTTTYTYDAADRLTATRAGDAGAVETFVYDARGALTRRVRGTASTAYEFDAAPQLTKVTLPDGRTVAYAYAPTGERISRQDRGGLAYYVYDGINLLQELGADLRARDTYVHAPGIDRPLAMIRGGQIYFFHADRNGSILAVTDAKGAVAGTWDYDAFGAIVSQTGSLTQPFGYTGREFDAVAGLYYYRARFYDPALGRFLSADPASAAFDDPLTLNPYLYTKNSPVRFVDPIGLTAEPSGTPTPVLGQPGGVPMFANLAEQIQYWRWVRLHPNSEGYATAGRMLEQLEPIARARGIEIPPTPPPVNQLGRPPQPSSNLVRPENSSAGGSTEAGGAPNQVRPGEPSATGVTAPPPAPVPTPPAGVRGWINNPGNQGTIMLGIAAAQLAACLYQGTSIGNCLFAAVMGQGVAIGVRVIITTVATRAGVSAVAAATASTVVGVIGAVGFTTVEVMEAGKELDAAAHAMFNADAAAFQAALQYQAAAEQLKQLRDSIQAADRGARRGTQDIERANAKAKELLDAAESDLAGLPLNALCADAAAQDAKLVELKATLTRMLADLRAQFAQARGLAGRCRTLEEAAEIRRHLDAAAQVSAAIDRTLAEATAAKTRLDKILPVLVRGDDDPRLRAISAKLEEAARTLEQAEQLRQNVTGKTRESINGPDVFNARVQKLLRDIDETERVHNDLSFMESVVDFFRTQRKDVKKEFDAARSILRGLTAPEVDSGNTEDLKRLGDAANESEALRQRHADLVRRLQGLNCTFTPTDDIMNDIRMLVDDGKIESDTRADLLSRANDCEAGRLSDPLPPTRPSRPTDPDPPSTSSGGFTPRPPVSPDPAPMLTGALDLGVDPILEIRPGQNSRSVSVTLKGWRSNTAAPVRVEVRPAALPRGVTVFPGNFAEDAANLYVAGVSDRAREYTFSEAFHADAGTPPTSIMATIIITQDGAGRIELPLTVNVILPNAPEGTTISPVGPVPVGSGTWCVWRYKLFGAAPACWNFVASVCSNPRYAGRQEYEQVGINLSRGEADARIAELSSFYSDAYGCRGTTPPPPIPPPTNTGTGDPQPPVPPTSRPPDLDTPPPTPAGGRTLSRFGIFPHTATIRPGQSVTLQAFGVYSDAPNTTVDLSSQVQWSPGNTITASSTDVGRSITVTANFAGASDSVSVTVDAAAPGDTTPPGGTSAPPGGKPTPSTGSQPQPPDDRTGTPGGTPPPATPPPADNPPLNRPEPPSTGGGTVPGPKGSTPADDDLCRLVPMPPGEFRIVKGADNCLKVSGKPPAAGGGMTQGFTVSVFRYASPAQAKAAIGQGVRSEIVAGEDYAVWFVDKPSRCDDGAACQMASLSFSRGPYVGYVSEVERGELTELMIRLVRDMDAAIRARLLAGGK